MGCASSASVGDRSDPRAALEAVVPDLTADAVVKLLRELQSVACAKGKCHEWALTTLGVGEQYAVIAARLEAAAYTNGEAVHAGRVSV